MDVGSEFVLMPVRFLPMSTTSKIDPRKSPYLLYCWRLTALFFASTFLFHFLDKKRVTNYLRQKSILLPPQVANCCGNFVFGSPLPTMAPPLSKKPRKGEKSGPKAGSNTSAPTAGSSASAAAHRSKPASAAWAAIDKRQAKQASAKQVGIPFNVVGWTIGTKMLLPESIYGRSSQVSGPSGTFIVNFFMFF